VKKTTLDLPDHLKQRLERAARVDGISEAEFIRAAIESHLRNHANPRPRFPLFDSGNGTIAGRVDELLAEGFGRD
jgi:hypothetical protein